MKQAEFKFVEGFDNEELKRKFINNYNSFGELFSDALMTNSVINDSIARSMVSGKYLELMNKVQHESDDMSNKGGYGIQHEVQILHEIADENKMSIVKFFNQLKKYMDRLHDSRNKYKGDAPSRRRYNILWYQFYKGQTMVENGTNTTNGRPQGKPKDKPKRKRLRGGIR